MVSPPLQALCVPRGTTSGPSQIPGWRGNGRGRGYTKPGTRREGLIHLTVARAWERGSVRVEVRVGRCDSKQGWSDESRRNRGVLRTSVFPSNITMQSLALVGHSFRFCRLHSLTYYISISRLVHLVCDTSSAHYMCTMSTYTVYNLATFLHYLAIHLSSSFRAYG